VIKQKRRLKFIISEFDGEDLEIKVFHALTDAENQAHDTCGMGAKRVRVYRVYPDPHGGQLSERIDYLDFDDVPAAA
jgi:hypothetical protein